MADELNTEINNEINAEQPVNNEPASDEASYQDITDALRFDFTKDTPKSAKKEEPVIEPRASAPVPVPAPQDNAKDLLVQRAMELLAANNKPTEPVKQDNNAAPAEDLPQYNFQIPTDILEAVGAEDPAQRAAGIQALTTGLAVTIHRQIRAEFAAMLNNRFAEVPNIISTTQQQNAAREHVFKDFYGSYPALQNEKVRPFVMQAAADIIKETGKAEYTPEFKQALYDRTQQNIAAVIQASGLSAAPAPVAPKAPAAKPAGTSFVGGKGARPVQDTTSIAAQIADMAKF